MAHDEDTAARLRQRLQARLGATDLTERRMMGALVFLLGGHMLCGVTKRALMLRLGPQAGAEALARPHVRPMAFGGRQPRGFVLVDPPGFATDAALDRWLDQARAFVATLPTKPA